MEESLLVSQGKLSVTPTGSVFDGDQAYAGVEKPKKSRSKCYKCGVWGHLARDCMFKKKDGEPSSDSNSAQATIVVQAF